MFKLEPLIKSVLSLVESGRAMDQQQTNCHVVPCACLVWGPPERAVPACLDDIARTWIQGNDARLCMCDEQAD